MKPEILVVVLCAGIMTLTGCSNHERSNPSDINGTNFTRIGCQWTPANTGLPDSLVHAFGVIGGDLYAGTSGKGIYHSADSGQSWSAKNGGSMAPTRYVTSIVISIPYFFAGTDTGVLITQDYGASWFPIGLVDTSVTCMTGTDAGNLFVGYYGNDTGNHSGVYRFAPPMSIVSASTGLPHNSAINCLYANGTMLYAGTNGYGLYQSSNNGTTWTATTGLTGTTVTAVSVHNRKILVGTFAGGVSLSTDNGASWAPSNTGLPQNTTVMSLFVSENVILMGTYGSGVYLSYDDGASWSAANNGLPAGNLGIAAITSNGAYLFVSTMVLTTRKACVYRSPLQ